jgi:hypothetical protein
MFDILFWIICVLIIANFFPMQKLLKKELGKSWVKISPEYTGKATKLLVKMLFTKKYTKKYLLQVLLFRTIVLLFVFLIVESLLF